MILITIHGIRRQNKWYDTIKNFPELSGHEVRCFDYGYLYLLRFLIPSQRRKVIDEFLKFYSIVTQGGRSLRDQRAPSLICHSFGTYIFFSAISKYEVIKFSNVILCGTILKADTDWKPFFEKKQIVKILHEYGLKDSVVGFSKCILKFGGNSGKVGFNKSVGEYSSFLIQEKRNFDHSDYFYPNHMREKWLPFIISENYKYDPKIMRLDVVGERISTNCSVMFNSQVQYTLLSYMARIDIAGNYYARYEIEGVNIGGDKIKTARFATTADCADSFSAMGFNAFDTEMNPLNVELVDDEYSKKVVTIHFDNPILVDRRIYYQCRFKWLKTINLTSGDTDHFAIKGAQNVNISLNFSAKLKNPKYYLIKNKAIVEEVDCDEIVHKDGSFSYTISVNNNDKKCEGVVFYFTGMVSNFDSKKRVFLPVPLWVTAQREKYTIAKCAENDVRKVYALETNIDYDNAASEAILKERLHMFNDGFLVVKDGRKRVVGYLESVIWKDMKLYKFQSISDFPIHHDVAHGDTLFIIFLAVDPDHRKRGLGAKLVDVAIMLAQHYGLNKIKLVAKEGLETFYQKRGFSVVKQLPNYLDNATYKSVLMEKNCEGR